MVLLICDLIYVMVLLVCAWGIGYCMADIRAYKDDKIRMEGMIKTMQQLIREGREFLDEIDELHYDSHVHTGPTTSERRNREREEDNQELERLNRFFSRNLSEGLARFNRGLSTSLGLGALGGAISRPSWYSSLYTSTTTVNPRQEPEVQESKQEEKVEETEVNNEPTDFDDFDL